MYKMRAGILVMTLLLVMAAFSQPHFHKHHHHLKREMVNEHVAEPPEIVGQVDGAGNTVKLETASDVVTHTQYECPTGKATVKLPTAAGMGVADPAAPDHGEYPQLKVPVPTTLSREPMNTKSSVDPPVVPSAQSPAAHEPKDPISRVTHSVTTTTTLVLSSAVTTSTPSKALVGKDTTSRSTSGHGDELGICYSPYNDDNSCKSQEQVNEDFSRLTEYSLIRSYGVDCNQIGTTVKAAKLHNKKLFIGVFEIHSLDKDLQTLIKSVGSSWDRISAVSIGNELVNSGKTAAGDVVNAVNKGRDTLRNAGYSGPVVTVDTFNAILDNPQLCHASDFCAANCHAFFDPNTSAPDAGAFVKKQAGRVSDAVGGKKTIITESGWPHDGSANGKAVPSDQNQEHAIVSLKKSFADGGLYLFSAFDNGWKDDNPSTFNAEKHWGVL